MTPLRRLAIVAFLCVVGVTTLACGIGAEFLARHMVAHDASLAADLSRLLLTRSLPESAFIAATPGDAGMYAQAAHEIVASADVVRVVLYDAQARVLWSDDPNLIGRRFDHDRELQRALKGRLEANLIRPGKEEHQGTLRSFARMEEIYVPVRYTKDSPVVGALEIYRYPAEFFEVLDRGLAFVWLLGGGGGLLIYAALFAVVALGIVDVRSTALKLVRAATDGVRSATTLRWQNDALEAETRRIAHELHDEAGQLIAAAKLALADMARDVAPGACERVQQMSGVLDELADQLRRLAHELRPMVLEDLGLMPAIRFLAEGVSSRTALNIRVTGSVDGRLPATVETALYRVAQEALTNVVKHAHATTLTIHLARDVRHVRCSIEDDGVGSDMTTWSAQPESRGLGLIGIKHRVEALGGTCRIAAAIGQGMRLTVSIPVS
jgi:signal transduction histidine kinase